MTLQLARNGIDVPNVIRDTNIGFQHAEWTLGRFEAQLETAEREVGRHPFVDEAKRMSSIERPLTPEQLTRWLCLAGWHCSQFVDILEKAIRVIGGPDGKFAEGPRDLILQVLRRNLADENGVGQDGRPNPAQAHHRQYLDVASSIGCSREQFQSCKIDVDIANSIAALRDSSEAAEMLGYVLVNERLISGIFKAMCTAFTVCFEKDVEFFRLHTEIDDVHVNQLTFATDQCDAAFDRDVIRGIELGQKVTLGLLESALRAADRS